MTTKKLLQTRIDDATWRKFKKLASFACNTTAGYLRSIVVAHVKTNDHEHKNVKDVLIRHGDNR